MPDVDALTPAETRALRFIFDTEREYYEEVRHVWGIPIVFRVISADEAEESDAVASYLAGDATQAIEREKQALARAVQTIGDRDFAALPIEQRLKELGEWPAVLVQTCGREWRKITLEFQGFLTDAETLGN